MSPSIVEALANEMLRIIRIIDNIQTLLNFFIISPNNLKWDLVLNKQILLIYIKIFILLYINYLIKLEILIVKIENTKIVKK